MKAKDNIEEIILNNLKELNDFEPKDGHFERFQAKLNAQKKKKTITLNVVWKVAAAVVFVLLALNQAKIYFSPENGNGVTAESNADFTLASVSPEYKEVEFYYTNAINVELNQWNSMVADGFISKEEQEMLDSEMTEFETRFKNLQTDLKANPNDERVINAMLEYYQAKLDIINMIVNKLEEVKQQKNKNHETI
ncbi:MAG TPA: hypothetical protein P5210_02815 [Draconibacterium sp.]|nr:hypothetical protein [Draconibacterium sp.]HRX10551.1 hypothetical protein [Draconibacterium sp.]